MSDTLSDFQNSQLNDFFQGYLDCALWSETDESDESGGEPLDRNYDSGDIHPDAKAEMLADCRRFFLENKDAIHAVEYGRDTSDSEMCGHDFWLTRNGHGVGFWDRIDDLEFGDDDDDERTAMESAFDRLNGAAQAFGEAHLYIGDDGQIHYFNS